MNDIFKKYLFAKHILVSEMEPFLENEEAFCSVFALAKKFRIRIIRGARLANRTIVHDAADYLGEYVPESFYRGFPYTVRKLSSDDILFDKLLHYAKTYGLGWFEEPGHSVFEEDYERLAFNEQTTMKEFSIIAEDEAEEVLKKGITTMLAENSRPLNLDNSLLVYEGVKKFGTDILPERIPCKDTAVELLYKTGNPAIARSLSLSDVIKLVDYIQYNSYRSEDLKHLNLRNQDRKLITKVLDSMFERGECDLAGCFEKQQIWQGLLHHIHYKPKTAIAERFVRDIRELKNLSCMSIFENYLREGDPVMAATYLVETKGSGALMRNLNYILSRCKMEWEVEEVLKNV